MAPARNLAVNGDKVRAVRPGFADPTDDGGKQRRINPVHQDR
jgi:hypothetical protein